MNPKHLTTLDYPKILEQLAAHTRFSASRELALSLIPSPHRSEAGQRQAETGEARLLLSLKPDLSVGGARDLRPMLQQASISATLLPTDLLTIRQTLIAARDLKRMVMRLADQVPFLADIAGRMHECPALVQEIERSIDERGEVLDTASAKLGHIRSELEIVHTRLLDRLNRVIHSSDNSQYLQESFITQRQGRYVIPLRAEFKGRIQGVIHDQSSSGATLFVEPLATVGLNNQWRQLQLDEEQEVRRILLALSQRVDEEADHIQWTVEALAELDLALAKAGYAEQLGAVEPLWPDQDGSHQSPVSLPFKLFDARHPLLDPDQVVPVDVLLPKETFILIITGPNTGGKTVTLKTIGLLVAMAQAGLHIPAGEGSSLPFFRTIYADIGDEQSIEQSLSTFSSHLTNIVQILEECDQDSLLILDELGAGTDPVEGSALARAILEDLNRRQMMTFVATHYSELKAYAHQTPGVVNASVEFNADTLSPTYRLQIGLPGRSNAFAIAERLGLPESIIAAADAMVSPEARQTESMLLDIQTELESITQEREAAATLKLEAQARLEEINQRMAAVDQERRDILNSARADARREIKAVREELRQLRERQGTPFPPIPASQAPESASPESAGAPLSGKELETTMQNLEEQLVDESLPAPLPPSDSYRGPIKPGDQVWVQPFQALGEVISSQRGQVEIQLGHFRTTVRRRQVELRKRAGEMDTDETQSPDAEEGVNGGSSMPSLTAESPGMELDLRGLTADEALHRLDLYLDDAYLVELPWVRIIHGKGTGVLKAVVQEALRKHSLVTSYRSGEESEGGTGVTVAKLAVG